MAGIAEQRRRDLKPAISALIPEKCWATKDERWEHAFGKARLDVERPIKGRYRYERHVADKRPDAIIENIEGKLNAYSVQIIRSRPADLVQVVEHLLRYGYYPFLVIELDSAHLRKYIRAELGSNLADNHQFGTYSPYTGEFNLGDPITFDNYQYFPQHLLGYELVPACIKQSKAWKLNPDKHGHYYVGTFEFPSETIKLHACDYHGREFMIERLGAGEKYNVSSETVRSNFSKCSVRRIDSVGGSRPLQSK